MQRWVSMVNVCSLCVCLLYVCICGCFVNGVCIHGLAVVEALWRPTGILMCASMQCTTWEPGVDRENLAICENPLHNQSSRYTRAVFGDMSLCGITVLAVNHEVSDSDHGV